MGIYAKRFLAVYGPWGGPLLTLHYVKLSINSTIFFATIHRKKYQNVGLNIDSTKIYHRRHKFEPFYIMIYATGYFLWAG